jgi:hypothetical protein
MAIGQPFNIGASAQIATSLSGLTGQEPRRG